MHFKQLVSHGGGWGKTANVAAVMLRDIHIVTETSAGEEEVHRNIMVEPVYITFDTEAWPTAHGRKVAIRDIAIQWANKLIGERDINTPDFMGPGIWVNKRANHEFDYMPLIVTEPNKYGEVANDLHAPNPEGVRLCLVSDSSVYIPVPWDPKFLLKAGGVLAIRERDVPDLVKALDQIEAGAKPEDVLYRANDKGQRVAVFDIYAMEPGFLEKNYGSVPLKSATDALLRKYRGGVPAHVEVTAARPDQVRPKSVWKSWFRKER